MYNVLMTSFFAILRNCILETLINIFFIYSLPYRLTYGNRFLDSVGPKPSAIVGVSLINKTSEIMVYAY